MHLLELSILLLAYSVGLVTLVIQVVCYSRQMEPLLTILFSLSFLALIMCVTIMELNLMITGSITVMIDELTNWAMFFLGLTTPLNVHLERKMKNRRIADRTVVIIFMVMGLALMGSYFTSFHEAIAWASLGLMVASVTYSMTLILLTKPNLMVKHREKTERRISRAFVVLVPVALGLHVWISDTPVAEQVFGPYALAFFYLFLTTNKLADDVKRLSLFRPENTIQRHVLNRFEISPRETEVVKLLIQGKSYNEIADGLHISLPTVKTHISRVYKKMQVSNKVELINLLGE